MKDLWYIFKKDILKLFIFLCVLVTITAILIALSCIPIPYWSWEGFFIGLVAIHLTKKVVGDE